MFSYAKPEQKQDTKSTVQKKEPEKQVAAPNQTGIPDTMKSRFENLSGFSFDDVCVHYNSDKPAQLQALAYTQGNQVHIAPGQEKHKETSRMVMNGLDIKTPVMGDVVQRFPSASRSLDSEKKAIDEKLEKQMSEVVAQEPEGEFDDDYMDRYDYKQDAITNSKVMHHILPQKAIRSYISKLDLDEKRDVLLEFIRFDPGTPEKNDVSAADFSKIRDNPADNEALIERMIEKTLTSLRSNLTLGPAVRGDDPKGKENDFDPNYKDGKMDDISAILRSAYNAIELLDGKDELSELELSAVKSAIPDRLKAAETMLAKKQGKASYHKTELEPYDPAKWEIGTDSKVIKRKD